jgi:hypothetical protein
VEKYEAIKKNYLPCVANRKSDGGLIGAQTVNGWFKHKVPGELVLKVKALEWKVTPHELDQISTQTQRMDYRRSNHANHLF